MGKTKQKPAGKTSGKLDANSVTAIATLITAIGGLMAIFLNPQLLDRFLPEPTPTNPPTITATLPATLTPTSTSTPTKEPSATPTEIVPRMWGFQACPAQCNGQNSTNNFVQGTTKIYIQFNYENIKPKASYERIWTMDGKPWIHYICAWDGPVSGTENIKLSEPDGLHSGVWEMTVKVDDVVLLQEQIVVVGNYKFWTPPGTVRACRLAN